MIMDKNTMDTKALFDLPELKKIYPFIINRRTKLNNKKNHSLKLSYGSFELISSDLLTF